jgi:hypothetical protein
MSNVKGNRVPISEKAVKREKPIEMSDVFTNDLDLDPLLAEELKKKNLVGRFINATNFKKTGSHRARWVPYQRESKSGLFGSDPEGFIRRGDLVLAVKPLEAVKQHRALLRQRAQAQSTPSTNANHAKQIREMAAESGVNTIVSEGFGEDAQGDE